jgi:hypothetical protein
VQSFTQQVTKRLFSPKIKSSKCQLLSTLPTVGTRNKYLKYLELVFAKKKIFIQTFSHLFFKLYIFSFYFTCHFIIFHLSKQIISCCFQTKFNFFNTPDVLYLRCRFFGRRSNFCAKWNGPRLFTKRQRYLFQGIDIKNRFQILIDEILEHVFPITKGI